MTVTRILTMMWILGGIAQPLSAQTTAPVPSASGPPTTASAEVTACAQAQGVVDQLLTTANARIEASRQSNNPAEMRAAIDALQTTVRDARAQLAPCANAASADPHARHAMPGMQTPMAMPGMPAPAGSGTSMDHSKMPMGSAPPAKPTTGAKPAAPAPMDHSKVPMGGSPAAKPATGAKPKPAAPAPMDHSKMPMGGAPAAKPTTGAKPATPAPMDHSKMPMGSTAQPAAADAHGGHTAPATTRQEGQAVDPVCGLNVDPDTAPKATHNGQTYYFCSEKHQQLFTKNPAKYLPKQR